MCPKLPFLQVTQKQCEKLDRIICKKVFYKIIVEIPLSDVIKISHAVKKYLKEVETQGFKSIDHHVMMVSESISAEIQGNELVKFQNPGSFVLDCNIHDERFQRSQCDLGSSVILMPYSVAISIGLTQFKTTRTLLSLPIDLSKCQKVSLKTFLKKQTIASYLRISSYLITKESLRIPLF